MIELWQGREWFKRETKNWNKWFLCAVSWLPRSEVWSFGQRRQLRQEQQRRRRRLLLPGANENQQNLAVTGKQTVETWSVPSSNRIISRCRLNLSQFCWESITSFICPRRVQIISVNISYLDSHLSVSIRTFLVTLWLFKILWKECWWTKLLLLYCCCFCPQTTAAADWNTLTKAEEENQKGWMRKIFTRVCSSNGSTRWYWKQSAQGSGQATTFTPVKVTTTATAAA